VDAHCHLVSYGIVRRREADLRGCSSIAEIQERLRAHQQRTGIREGGAWILGRGFDQELLKDGRWPTRADLAAVSADIPIRIPRVCGHALVANTAATKAAGSVECGYPRSGRMLSVEREGAGPIPQHLTSTHFVGTRTQHSTPNTGIFTEDGMAPFHRAVPEPTREEWRAAAAGGGGGGAGGGGHWPAPPARRPGAG